MKINKDKCVPSFLYFFGGLIFLLGGLRFNMIGDFVGAVIYSFTGILFVLASVCFYYMKPAPKAKKKKR